MGDAPFVLLDNAQPGFALLDNAQPGVERLSVFTEPIAFVTAGDAAEAGRALGQLDAAVAGGLHAAGYFSYELGYALESRLEALLPKAGPEPLLWLGVFRQRTEISGPEIEAWFDARVRGRSYAGRLRFEETQSSYAERFRRAQDYIGAGDIYQVNYTFPARFSFLGDPLALYRRLRRRAAAPHSAFVWDGARHVLSLSPELFFSVHEGVLTAKPMKGTAARGRDPEEDARLKAGLAASEKDRAENLMIVDLIRNDLGRVGETGSVRVDELFAIETYPTVHQMVSTVRAALRPDVPPSDLIRALFPCGSVIGTPKIRAQEIIRELEPSPRGVYCGAIGAFSPDGAAAFNVAIRTLTIAGNEGVLGVGGAIVADSTEEAEYQEALLKSRFYSEAREPIGLIETLRHEPGRGFLRGGLHLARLTRSAQILGIAVDPEQVLAQMTRAAATVAGAARIRVFLDEAGQMEVTASAFAPAARWTYALSERRMQSSDRLWRHKTAWRQLFEEEFAALHKATGCDQVLFLNERGEPVESNGANLFVRKGEVLVTPPLSSGALDGCLRRSLLESGECIEAVLTLADLEDGEVYLGNSLRGLMRAVPAPAPKREEPCLPPPRGLA